MNINKSCKLFLNEVYNYDIKSCHYNILKKIGRDVSKIPFNKKERNIYIGMMMKDDPSLTKILRSTTEDIISNYISVNNILDDDIIIRQYDGLLIKKVLKETNLKMEIELRNIYHSFLISINRKYFLAYDGKNISIKGVSNKYEKINEYLERIIKINFSSRKCIFNELQNIKNDFLTSEDPLLFCIPSREKSTVFLKKYGEIEISNGMSFISDLNDVDKIKYFDFYIKPFVQSIIYEFL